MAIARNSRRRASRTTAHRVGIGALKEQTNNNDDDDDSYSLNDVDDLFFLLYVRTDDDDDSPNDGDVNAGADARFRATLTQRTVAGLWIRDAIRCQPKPASVDDIDHVVVDSACVDFPHVEHVNHVDNECSNNDDDATSSPDQRDRSLQGSRDRRLTRK